jgi:hypothetical protein
MLYRLRQCCGRNMHEITLLCNEMAIWQLTARLCVHVGQQQ